MPFIPHDGVGVAIMNNAMLITAFYYYHDVFPSTSRFHDIMKSR
jgi:hypothetical protein